MLFYLTLFLLFLYFKIARVHYKGEKLTISILLQHFFVAISAVLMILYGVTNVSWYMFLGASLIFFIAAGLMIAAVQVGIFVDGKPFLGLSKIYRFLPILTILIVVLSIVATS